MDLWEKKKQERLANFKRQGVKQNRESQAQLRKSRRQDRLKKSRNIFLYLSDKDHKTDDIMDTTDDDNDIEIIGHIKNDNDLVKVYESLSYIRKKVSLANDEDNLYYIHKLNIVPELTRWLVYGGLDNHKHIHLEAACILTNLISGPSDIARDIIENTTLLELMFNIIRSDKDSRLRNQAIWFMGNVIGESDNYKKI